MIPSTLAIQPPPTLLPTDAERRDQRLREAGHDLRTCPTCGHRAWREEVLVHRPGQPSVTRVIVRCLRATPKGHYGQGAGQRSGIRPPCPLHIESETPLKEETCEMPTTATTEPHSETPCPCGCGNTVAEGRKFASRGCAGRYHNPPGKLTRRAQEASAPSAPDQAAPSPAIVEKVREAAGVTHNAVSLLALAGQLLELTPDEVDLVTRLVAAERARRTAA